MKIAILGGDGFCGLPTALHLSEAGHEVHVVDNPSRRRIDTELGVQSLTPMDTIQGHCRIWREVTGWIIHVYLIDLAEEDERVKASLAEHRPDAIVHLAGQRAASYSMRSDHHKVSTVRNDANATHNLLAALVEAGIDAHLEHPGTMGVCGYSSVGAPIPEGYLDVEIDTHLGERSQPIFYPTRPGSVYQETKSPDQILFQFYVQNDGLPVTDLHQGIVWDTRTAQIARHDQLVNCFDYDGDYGTVLDRFLIQAAVAYPLTVHGTCGQTRAFIHVRDSARCIELALSDAPAAGDRVRTFDQMTETHRVRGLAEPVARLTGARVAHPPNPRKEAAENDRVVRDDQFLGLEPTTPADGLLEEAVEVARRFAHRIDRSRGPAISARTRDLGGKVERDPEGRALTSVS